MCYLDGMAKGTTRDGGSRQRALLGPSERLGTARDAVPARFGAPSRAAAPFERLSGYRGLPLRVGALCRLAALATALLLSATAASAQAPNLCDVGWHQSARGSGAVTAAVGNGADVNQSCGSGSSPLLLALEYGRADVVLALIRAGASLEHRDPYSRLTPVQVINDRCDAGRMDRRVCDEVRRGFEARAEAHNNLCDPRWWRSFYRQSESQARSRMEAVMRTPGAGRQL